MLTGTIKKWEEDKGWGFIEGDDGEDYFIKAPMNNKTGWINKIHVKGFALKNKLTKKLCD